MKGTAVAATCALAFSFRNILIDAQDFDESSLYGILDCFVPCNSGYTGNEVIPNTGCVFYHECWDGAIVSRKGCGSPLAFNVDKDFCDFPSEFSCLYDDFRCPEPIGPTTSQPTPPVTGATTSEPIEIITNQLTSKPVETTSNRPTPGPPQPSNNVIVVTIPTTESPTPLQIPNTPDANSQLVSDGSSNAGDAILHIESKRELIENFVLVSYNSAASGLAYPSKLYTYDSFIQSLQIMGVNGFGADFKFSLWEGNGNKIHYGLVNLAAFLSNSMVESIEFDMCDEWNWEQLSGRHAIANSCGQEKRSYQSETCHDDAGLDIFSCNVDPEMKVKAVTTTTGERAPPPLECKPRSSESNSGYWDATTGTLIANVPYSNELGRTDTEGCCWWGRGALLTRGVCNIGKINYYLGKGGADLGRSTLYPTLDFCQSPESICASEFAAELRWSTAFFEWSERIERYNDTGWVYEDELKEFVDNGMVDDSFIDSVSHILSRGCHKPSCSELEVRMLDKRRSNFYMIINDIFDIKTQMNPPDPTPRPTTQPPTPRPTRTAITKHPAPWPTRVTKPPLSVTATMPEEIAVPVAGDHTEIQKVSPSPTGSLWYKPSTSSQPKDHGGSQTFDENTLIGLEGNAAPFSYQKQIASVTVTIVFAISKLLLPL